ncbi:MAG: DUF4114 domain-containing protein [Ginsengibacter sp.]
MKIFNSFVVVVCVILFVSCKKNPERTGPFKETTYKTLGSYDNNGLPGYLEQPDIISPQLRVFMNSYLVDSRNLTISNPELFNTNAIADITIVKPTTLYMTYVHQATDGNSALGFYTYPTNNPPLKAKDIKEIVYAFPNAGGKTTLKPGDKVKLGSFSPGTSVGFVLLVNAWDLETRKLNPNAIHYCTNDILNPETDPSLRKHAVLINYAPENKILIGFEDQNRMSPGCDHDFNDAVFYCTIVFN